ncbi:MAG TPA: cellulase family glycosylhydrolase [Acidimicrobiales bacterium]
MFSKVFRRACAMAVAIGLVGVGGLAVGTSYRAAATPPASVQVQGNQLVDGSGNPIRLVGVDRSGTEYACAQGWGIFDGPSDQGSIQAISSWHVNAVRVPLNEDCWLGINGVNPSYSGANYQTAIENYVSQLHAAGMMAILDLHWSAPGGQLALGQQMMADSDHSPAFWTSVASAFKADRGVAFDLYNEPHDISWSCWLNGCVTSAGWRAAGMQSLLNSVRSTGATQPVMVAGLNWAGDLSGWLQNEPNDPSNQLAASAHIYNYSQCNTPGCWDSTIAPVAAQAPVVTGELGETDCARGFIDSYMAWADAHGLSYLGWSWNTASCGSGPALITSYNGTPTAFGAGYQSHLAAIASQPSGGGVYVLDGYGNLDPETNPGGPARVATSDTWSGWNIARGAAGLPDDTGGYTLDGWGGVHPFAIGSNPMPPAATTSDYWPEWDIARSVALLPSGQGGYVLDGWGGVHPFAIGSNPMPPAASASAYWPEKDIARSIVVLPSGTGGYVLDGYGGVHPFAVGSNPMPAAAVTSASWSGWDIARSLTLLPSGSGGYVVDGWGGVHPFATGSSPMPPAVNSSGYWPYQDVARGVALNSAGTVGYVDTTSGQVATFAVSGSAAPSAGTANIPSGAVGRAILVTS